MDGDSAGPIILETLRQACSQDPSVLTPAEHKLQQWQTQAGFYTILSSIFCNHEIEVNVRWLAVMYIKNGVDRYWRRTAPNAISEEEREVIRQRLLSNFNEPSAQICTQMAVLVAKIARLDCPRNWPTLLPGLLQAVRCDNQLLQERSLLVLHHVIKTLASKRLAPDRKLFEDLTNEIFSYLYGVWSDQLTEFLHMASVQSEEMTTKIDRPILALRILRRMVIFGVRDPADNQEAMNFLNQVFVKLEAMLECRQSMWGNHKMIEKCEKMINILTKVLLDSLEHHPVCYLQFIQRTLQFVVKYNFSHHGLLFERFTVNCFNLMKNILLCDAYRTGKHETEPEQIKVQATRIKAGFFTFDMLREVCQRLISQYFLLNHDDLTTWDSDPEEFCQEEVGDTYKYALRPCTESLFLGLFKEYRLSLSSVLLKMVQDLQSPPGGEDNSLAIQVILRKDAVYNAVGLAAFDLFDDIDFDRWFQTHLLDELKIGYVNYRIIRRRVIWLCGQWVGVKMAQSLRPALYAAICPLLEKNEDLVVRLEAANTLKLAVDDFEFNVEQFLPYLEVTFSLLFQLLKEVQQCDTKMQVLHVISFVIERVGVQIRPYAGCLVSYLPALWEESREHNMLKCAILTTLIHIVQSIGSTTSSLSEFLLPVIELSTDSSRPEHVYLLDDGLELWHVTLVHTETDNTITQSLVHLYKNMADLLELSTENIRMCLRIIEDYLLLCPTQFMECYSADLVKSFTSLLMDVRTEGVILILKVIEQVFRCFPVEAPQVFNSMLPGFLQSIINQDEHPMVMSVYVTLVARISLQNQQFFWTMLEQYAQHTQQQMDNLLLCLMNSWIDTIDNMTQPERRKLSALALSSLLTTNNSVILKKFGSIVNVCVQVLHDVYRVPVDEDTVIQLDALVLSEGSERSEEQDTEHDKRRRAVTRKDPVHSIPLKDFVFQQLAQCRNLYGEQTFTELTKQVAPEVYGQLTNFSSRLRAEMT